MAKADANASSDSSSTTNGTSETPVKVVKSKEKPTVENGSGDESQIESSKNGAAEDHTYQKSGTNGNSSKHELLKSVDEFIEVFEREVGPIPTDADTPMKTRLRARGARVSYNVSQAEKMATASPKKIASSTPTAKGKTAPLKIELDGEEAEEIEVVVEQGEASEASEASEMDESTGGRASASVVLSRLPLSSYSGPDFAEAGEPSGVAKKRKISCYVEEMEDEDMVPRKKLSWNPFRFFRRNGNSTYNVAPKAEVVKPNVVEEKKVEEKKVENKTASFVSADVSTSSSYYGRTAGESVVVGEDVLNLGGSEGIVANNNRSRCDIQ